MATLKLTVNAGPHARCDTPLSVDLGDAAKGQTLARLTEADTGRPIPCQLDGTKLVFVLPGLGAKQSRGLSVELGAEGYRHGGVKVTDEPGKGVAFEINGKPLTTYRYAFEGEYPLKARPFFYPVLGPGGVNVTRHYPMRTDVDGEMNDHPHHRGLYVAYGDVNGSDNWSEAEGFAYQTHQGFDELVGGPVFGRFTERLHWEDNRHKKQCSETRVFTAWNVSQEGRIFDLSVTFHADVGDVKFGDTKEGGLCAIRVPTTMDGKRTGLIENAAGGIGENECWGKPAAWVDYHGQVEGQHLGIAIMDHPFNLRHPTPWHVRDYGLFGANPFAHSYYKWGFLQNGDYTLRKGESLAFKYRVYFHRGGPVQGDVGGKWADYAFAPEVKVAQ